MEKNVLNTDLSGKVAVVTGAGGVLCSEFARVLARAGAKVALLNRTREKAQRFADEAGCEIFQELPDGRLLTRFVCSWATTDADVDDVLELARSL